MKKVGITGGMGCGKSTVVEEFARLGVPAFVADKAGAELYKDAGFLSEVRQLLGDGVFRADGSVDKREIASRVFAEPRLLKGLNAMVHPRVLDAFDVFCRKHADATYVLFESAILYDYGFDRLMDEVICVYLSLEDRLERLEKRDGVGREALLSRIGNQLAAEEMMSRADYVILNYEGNPRQRQVAYIDNLLRR